MRREIEQTVPGYYTKFQSAAVSGVTTETISQWIKRGLLTPYRAGQNVLIAEDELDRVLSERNHRGVA